MEPKPNLERLRVQRKNGRESFRDGSRELPSDVASFWQWAASDLVSNTTRGILAEYVVGMALGCDLSGVRAEWAPHDLVTPAGTNVEVKASSYLQSWHQQRISPPSFSIRSSRAWCADTNTWGAEARRQADVYVFALLAHRCKNTVDPMDVAQWEFYVVPAAVLDATCGEQKTIGWASLRRLADPTTFAELLPAVEAAARPASR